MMTCGVAPASSVFPVRDSDENAAQATSQNGMGFGLFVLLNAVLFLRPAEILPSLAALPIYQVVIVSCTIASLRALLPQLSVAALAAKPATVCIIGLLVAVALSHLTSGSIYEARMAAGEFGKVVLYFLLLNGLVDSPKRLRTFLVWVCVFIVAVAVLAVLRYHGVIDLDALNALEQAQGVDEFGDREFIARLQASGIFSDPNDFSLVLVTSLLILAHLVVEQHSVLMRLAYLIPVPLLLYAFALTQSRGGFLALIAGCSTYILTRWNWRRSLPIAVVVMPVLLIVLGGRQTSIDLNDEDDTAHGRVTLWRDGYQYFQSAPLFGIGYNQYAEESGLVAHNSYVHTFAELGFFGGTFFTGILYVPFAALRRMGSGDVLTRLAEVGRWRPCLMAALVAYMVGLCSLSRPYQTPTYLLVGVAVTFSTISAKLVPSLVPPVSFVLARRMLNVSFAVLVFFYLFVRIFA
jgi:putative inorganic carbon (hco3(-)) transporter